MKVIEYSPKGVAYSDAGAEDAARAFLKGSEDCAQVSTENFILATRALIHDGFISHKEVEFLFNGETIKPNSDGRIKWPNGYGFCDYYDRWLSRLLSPK